ncbi:MAG TPA: tetratricopeptide repeat protein [Spirochaetota bacterium]|nr:tetratricopeptide repeat protein [Spirochaetota bacterium]
MLVPILIALAVILGLSLVYFYVVAPRLNPYNRALAYLNQNQVDQAVLEFRKILDEDPNNFMVHWKLANIYFDKNDVDEGVLHLEEIRRIDKYNYEVSKAAVERKLAESYLLRDDLQKAFMNYFDVLKDHPGDEEALYHVAFILLGQEYFEQALRFFDRLIKAGRKDFEVLFGAGIASYQSQKAAEPVEYFREALSMNSHSDIANLAMAFAQQRKRDYKTALNYARMIIDTSSDESALLVARRLYALLCVQTKRPAEAVKVLESVLDQVRRSDASDEEAVILYDLGFAAVNAEMTELAYDYWNQLYHLDRKYMNVQHLTTMLRKEMDAIGKPGGAEGEDSVINHTDDWLRDAFPDDFLWNICGLKSAVSVDLDAILASARSDAARDDGQQRKKSGASGEAAENISALYQLDGENFRIIAGRAVAKMGFRVDEILPSYREPDGVDFLAINLSTKDKTLIWVRRWKDIRISEIPLRNLAQAVNDLKVKQGVFITTSELTDAAESAVERLPKVRVIFPEEFGNALTGLL